MAQNLIDFNQGVNNIAVWHAAAIGLIALEFNDATLLNTALNGDKGISTLLNKGITKDYIWYEGAFSYNNYVVAAMVPLFKFASIKGKSAILKTPMLMAQNMLLSPPQFQFDNGYLPTVGDTRGQIKAIDTGALHGAVRVLPTVTGVAEANRVRNWDSLLDPLKNNSTAPAPAPLLTSKVFESSRVAILKNLPGRHLCTMGS
ncbi:MAG: hypothetical protein IPN06_09200 [Burkholderiales bacterium]|nr:hypothetical protein [Burkholderiales bacterium]